jgi:UDP-N-acetylglucosamine/UDP-N-acetylgalactosamine diphosphorylase
MTEATDIRALSDRLRAVGQDHLLKFYPELDHAGKSRLVEQIQALDLDSLPRLIDTYVRNKPHSTIPGHLEPAPYFPHDPASKTRPWDKLAMRAAGESLLKRGKVAAFTVAGGQGSRLGFEGPKGMFPAGAVTGKTLFAFFAEGLRAAARKYGATVPWYIMTSPLNHQATVDYFESNAFLGLNRSDVMFFPQGVMPSFDMTTGKILLAAKDELATNPDGHGGSLKALFTSGAIDDMRQRGIQHISYFQVDNPLVRVVDPVFLGLHAVAAESSGEMSSKMIPKVAPDEKLGVFCSANGRVEIIEYSDLPRQLAEQRLPDGRLQFIAGSLAVHILSVEFVARLNTDREFSLPYHRAEKKVPYIDLQGEAGKLVQPEKPNAVKLERFVFDALPLCRGSIVYETSRAEEFAPIKNATGTDSVESSKSIQTARAATWLEAAGVKVPRKSGTGNTAPSGATSPEPDCTIELSPLTALEPDDLQGKPLPREIQRGARIAL